MPINHDFTSDVPDNGIPAGWVKPSNWNADHVLTGILGELDRIGVQPNIVPYLDGSSTGAAFLISAFVRSLMNSVDATAFLGGLNAAPLNSPGFTGTPTAPTPTTNDNTTKLATTAFVQAAISALVGGSPALLDTLNELAAAIGNDPNFATTMTNSLALKAPLASPALTGTPTAPTVAGTADSTTKIATTAFVQAVAALLAPKASPTFTGTPAAPTAAPGTNTTQLATTAFIAAAIAALGTAATKNVGTLANNVVQLDGSAKLPAVDGSALTGVNATLSRVSAVLGADVSLTDSALHDGPSVAAGTGTWFFAGYVTLLDINAAASFNVQLWDGTTIVASTVVTTSGANATTAVALQGFITNPAANVRISVSDSNGTPNGRIKFNYSAKGKDSQISGFKIG